MQKIISTLVDDMDGSEATSTIEFSVRGVQYSIDLGEKNSAKFDKALAPFIEHGTRIGGRAKRGSSSTVTRLPSDAGAIRAWAEANGLEVSARGRISQEVRDQFEAAQAS